MDDTDIARAIAYFETCEDVDLLRNILRSIQPRAAAAVRRSERLRTGVPEPRDIAVADAVASSEEALRTVRATDDFAQLQALSRNIGRRVEELMSRDR